MDPEQLETLVKECAPLVTGARVENVHQSPDGSVSLSLYGRDSGKSVLFYCVRPGLARFHLVSTRPPALPSPPPFCQALRKHLKGAHVRAVRVRDDRRSVELEFGPPGAGEESPALTLLFELRGGRGRLSLRGAGGRTLQTLDAGGAGGSAPASSRGDSPASSLPRAVASSPLPPLHARLAELYADRTTAVSVDGRRAEFRRQLRRALAKRERLLGRLRADLERAREGREARRFGELLKGSLAAVRRGMRSVEVQDYFDPEMRRVEVPLDPALSPIQNVELYFKRYSKAVRGIPIIEKRLARLTEERDAMRQLERDVEAAETPLDLDRLEPRVAGFHRRAAPPAPKGRGGRASPAASSGPRRFVSADGLDILVGRTAAGNDELTLRIARGNDLFLHVSGRPGSHVIVRLAPGRTVPPETLHDAACLAVYYSLSGRSRSRAVGAAADVDYTAVKRVRKPRGAPAGRVLLETHKTLRIRIDAARLERLLGAGDRGGPN